MDSMSKIAEFKSGISRLLFVAYAVVIVITAYHYHNYPINTVGYKNLSNSAEVEQNVNTFKCTIPHILPKAANTDTPDQTISMLQETATFIVSVCDKLLNKTTLCVSLRAPPSSV
jgi:hypothetical protein